MSALSEISSRKGNVRKSPEKWSREEGGPRKGNEFYMLKTQSLASPDIPGNQNLRRGGTKYIPVKEGLNNQGDGSWSYMVVHEGWWEVWTNFPT